MSDTPFANGSDGTADRRPDGRFASGNQAARGRSRPHAAKVNELRRALLDAVEPERIARIINRLAEAAEGGDTTAAKILLDRIFGPPLPADVIERVEELETKLGITP